MGAYVFLCVKESVYECVVCVCVSLCVCVCACMKEREKETQSACLSSGRFYSQHECSTSNGLMNASTHANTTRSLPYPPTHTHTHSHTHAHTHTHTLAAQG